MATINLNIKTAHGYLSLQPDGHFELRAEAGPWETFTIEIDGQIGLSGPCRYEAPPVPAPASPTSPAPTGTTVPASSGAPSAGGTTSSSPPAGSTTTSQQGGAASTPVVVAADAIDLSQAKIPAGDCPDVRHWPIMAPLHVVEFAATERFERCDTMVDFPGRDALPAASGSQGAIAYTLWMGCHIGGTWYIAPIVECIGGYVPTGQILATNQVSTNLFYYTDPPLRFYQPAPGERVAFLCTTGDTRRQNAQAMATPGRTNVVLVPFAVGRYVR